MPEFLFSRKYHHKCKLVWNFPDAVHHEEYAGKNRNLKKETG